MSLESRHGDRLLIDHGETYCEHTLERYYRKWTQGGRVRRGEKLALQMDEYDDQLSGRLGNLDWDSYHCTWDDSYQPAFSDESGAWTLDATEQTRDILETFGVMCPQFYDIPLVGKVHRFSLNGRECPACGNDSVCSSRDLDAFASWTDDMQVARDSLEITHICMSCHRWLEART